MPLFKCKMCGGSLDIESGKTVVECEYCGTKQTLPKLDDDKRANMYDRANHFRRNNEFDKAMGIYEHILNEDNTDAEAYWSLVLCRYGIEYVEDPTSHKRVPTVNRTQFTSVFDDDNYKSALQYADEYQRHIYEEEAKTINEIQKGILAISQNEEPFDVFICYKESDNNGRRTHDSVLAQELYYQLKQEGFKVFFSRITLEDKLGTAYEPYIFAALNSAKVMVVLGTKPEYFNAVWVKNEWSRYLSLIKQGQKKMLIPAYRDMDPYDLPEEFSHLQAQDMSKLGFMWDLVRGIKKIARVDTPKTTVVKETVIEKTEKIHVAPLLKRLHFFLEDEEWFEAAEYAEKVLDNDPECAEAYVGKLMAELHVKKQDELKKQTEPFDDNPNYKKALRFANEELKSVLVGYIDYIKQCSEEKRLNAIYTKAKRDMDEARMASTCQNLARVFESISNYKDSASMAKECYDKAESMRKDDILSRGKAEMRVDIISNYQSAIRIFQTIPGWKNADELVSVCQNNIEQLKIQEEERRRRAKEAIREAEKRKKKVKKIAIISAAIILAIVLFIIILTCRIIPNVKYNKATDAIANENYYDAYYMLDDLGDYKDSQDLKKLCVNKGASEIIRDVSMGRWSNFIIGCQAEELTIPNTVTEIKDNTFYGCNTLKTVVIPDSVTNIGSSAFAGCSNLENIIIPNSVTSIGKYAFSGCSSLINVSIPDSVTSIGDSAFHNCSSLESITIPFVGAEKDGTQKTRFGYIFGGKNYIANHLNVPESLKTVIITGGTSIGDYAFYNCTGITSITIPDSVTSIDYDAFYNCTNLTNIYYTGTIKEWNNIYKSDKWNSNTGDYTIHCTDGDI